MSDERYWDNHCSRWSGIKQDHLHDFNRLSIEILVRAFATGVYNLRVNWDKAEFSENYSVFVIRTSEMATFDFDHLSRLVFLAHEECVRVSIGPHTFRHLEIMMHRRVREGDTMHRHPTLEQAIAAFRGRAAIT